MSVYRNGYRDGFNVALLENAEQVYLSQRDVIEAELLRLAAFVQRTPPSRCKREMRLYIDKSMYLNGFIEGYKRGRAGNSPSNRHQSDGLGDYTRTE